MLLRWSVILVIAVGAVVHIPVKFLGAHTALNGSTRDDGAECRVPSGRLLFLHIMKAGGTSIDAFLACHCKRVGCSLMLSLGPFQELHGNKNCESPAMCTTHGEYRNRKELCGADFEYPSKVITTFREPVSRVFSLYNYQKQQGMNLPSIAELYQKCDAEQIDEKKPLGWMCQSMTNHMVAKTFADKDHAYSSTFDPALLGQAKKAVSNLDAFWFLQDFDRFEATFGEANLVDNEYIDADKPRCELGHSNPTECQTCAEEPTAAEVELIKQHNEMDIALYDFAATLPNRKRP